MIILCIFNINYILLEISGSLSNIISDSYVFHYGNELVSRTGNKEIRHFVTTNYDQKYPFAHPPYNTCFSGPPKSTPSNGISIGSAVFAQLAADGPYTLQGTAAFSSHNWTVPWVQPSPQPEQHLDRFSRFAGIRIVTDRQTDRPTTLFRL